MPRPAKGPRLYLDKSSGAGSYVIRDGKAFHRTGCSPGDREGAERQLADYIVKKYDPARSERRLADIPIGDVINIYLKDRVPLQANVKAAIGRCIRLAEWWHDKTLDQITGAMCRAYAASRPSPGGARRDLQDLAAAIAYHHQEGLHRDVIIVPLPAAGPRRDRWLTRSEIAALVWAAWRMGKVVPGRGKRPAHWRWTGRHIARAILMAYYTGSRIGTVLTASFHAGSGRSYIDLDRGTFFRLPEGKTETDKRQPPVRIGKRLMSHLRRWKRRGLCASYVVEWEGLPVKSIKTGWNRVVEESGLEGDIVPHTLRHSRATHMKQAGISSFEVGQALGMSEKIVDDVYGHWDPAFTERAANKIPTLFERDWNGDKNRVLKVVNPKCQWVIDGEGVASRKIDGTCCLVRGGKLFKRYELRDGKTAPAGFELVDTDAETGKSMGWMPVGDGPEDKWHRQAFEKWVSIDDGTYELVGPKIQGNPEAYESHDLVSHAHLQFSAIDPPRNFDGLRSWLANQDIEGIVWHHADGRMAKIKKRDFGLRRVPGNETAVTFRDNSDKIWQKTAIFWIEPRVMSGQL
eukprot:gene19616-20065_t